MQDHVGIACPGCAAVNRVPAARLGDRPACGKCRAGLFQGRPVPVSAATFDAHVGRTGLPVVVDFWAPWCGPCRAMAPAFERAAAELEPRVRFAKIDTEAESALAGRFGIRSIPTLVIFQDGREIARTAGARDAAGIVSWVRSTLRG
jgi:thioredoxin 2